MAKKTEELHGTILKRFERAEKADRDNRDAGYKALAFRAGEDHWPANVRAERERDGRPCLTINRVPQFLHQVVGDIRQNKPAIKVRPVDGGADRAVAEVQTGLIRHIEQSSNAEQAYVYAADCAATCGIGNFRINVDYTSDDSFEQDILIERILNPYSVVWDDLAIKQDKSDAEYCFVIERMTREAFQDRWPNASIDDFSGQSDDGSGPKTTGWWSEDDVRVAEYWCVKVKLRELALLGDGSTVYLDEIEGAGALQILKQRQAPCRVVESYIVSGSEILEGPSPWAGKWMPIVPVVGEEMWVGNRVKRQGIVEQIKDSQVLFNYMRSTSAEVIALQPKAPIAVTVKQIAGYESYWEQAGRKNLPYLPYNSDPNAPGPPQRISPPVAATGLIAEAGLAADDMKAITGIYDASLGQRSNETSGRAILARQREGDTGTFLYIDNLSAAIGHCGRILIDLIPRIYDTERQIRILGEDGSEELAEVNKTVMTMQGPVVINDLTRGKYDVVVSAGPSYSTKRVEAADSMMQFVQAVPGAAAIISDLVAKNMDWPGAEQISERLKKMLPPGIAEDGPPAQPPQPDPKMVADAQKSMAEAEYKAAQTEGQKLANVQTGLEIQMATGGLQQLVGQLVQQALAGMGLAPQQTPVAGPMPPVQGGPPGQSVPMMGMPRV